MSSDRREPIVVTHEGGLRFAARVRSHTVVVDQPVGAGGDDVAPTPLELMATSLATCVALYVQQYLHSRRLPYEGMRVEVDQIGAGNPHRIGELSVRVALPATIPEEHMRRLEHVARSCPAHATLTHSPSIRVAIESREAVPAA